MPYLDLLLAAYRRALSTERPTPAQPSLGLADARALLAAASSPDERGRALAAVAIALVRHHVIPVRQPLAARRPSATSPPAPAYETGVTPRAVEMLPTRISFTVTPMSDA